MDNMSDEEPPKIVFERTIIYNSGTHRVSIPLEIVKALNIEKGDTMQISLENSKIVMRKKK